MLREERQLAATPEDLWDALRERQEAWDRRRRLWECVRAHENLARCHELLAEEHSEAAIKLLEEVSA
jgi:hypothetical protein